MSDETYEFVKKLGFCLIVCKLYKSEGVLASAKLKQVKDTIDKIAEAVWPTISTAEEDESVFIDAAEAAGSSNGRQPAQSKKAFMQMAPVGLRQNCLLTQLPGL